MNSIATLKGGTHVTHVADQMVEFISKKVTQQNKAGMTIKPAHVKSHLLVFVNCLIENPTFDSQTKETMKLQQSKFGSDCKMPKKFMDGVLNSGVCDLILQWAKAKEKIDLGKGAGGRARKQILGIPKLEDANDAGGKNSEDCTLILTEGDSAKALAVAGLSVVGRDKFGVFPLRGKPLNVRECSHKAMMGNAEIQNIFKILGLNPNREYNDTTQLRYGSVMIMADQDFDGSHIKGLLLNMIAYWWPSLLKLNGFVREFITPIVKVWKGDVKKSFFTVGEYEEWKRLNNNGKGWNMKYYKGLGTSTSKEAKEYFKAIEDHGMSFEFDQEAEEVLDLAFNKKRADDRKDWINAHTDGQYVDHTQASVTYKDFVHKELVLYAKYDLYRMIPHLLDGLKPSQRKVLYSCIKRKLTKDIKVAQLSGYVSEHAAYHHGEASLQTTIVNMAQDFVGSNNLNLLVPSGQFGTRLAGGKDSASARYIYTRLQAYTRQVYHPDDDALLEYQDEEGQKIEPKWYIPVIPMVLCNGAEGIGSGWSTLIPNYNPRDLIIELRKYLAGKKMKDLIPWYRGYKGSITAREDNNSFETWGVIEKVNEKTLEIKELPVKSWTQTYKEFLSNSTPNAVSKPENALLQDFREYHTETSAHFVLFLTEEQMAKAEKVGLADRFKLRSNVNTSNMVLWNAESKIQKFDKVQQILEQYCPVRLEFYKKRKTNLLVKLRRDCEVLRQKSRFVQMVISNKLELRNKKKSVLLKELAQNKFLTKAQIFEIYFDEFTKNKGPDDENGNGDNAANISNAKEGYEYLLGMALWSLTAEKVADLKADLKAKEEEVKNLENQSAEQLWDNDLTSLVRTLDELDAMEKKLRQEEKNLKKGKQGKALTRQQLVARKKTVAQKRKAEIRKEAVKGGDSDSDDDAPNSPTFLLDFSLSHYTHVL